MARTIGSNLVNTRRFVIERFGLSGWAKMLAQVSPQDREALAHVTDDGWFDEGLFLRQLGGVARGLGGGELKLLDELGRHNAERDISGPQRLFFRLANPAWVLEKSAEYWRKFHDTGIWEIQRQSHGAIGTLSNFEVVDEAFCATVNAYIGRLFELVGAKGAVSEHPQCRARKGEHCVFVVRWQ
jgi:hypothetical protein